jgi:hypothetical protein
MYMLKLRSIFLYPPYFILILSFIVLITGFFLISKASTIAYAQLSGCGEINIGNPPANVTIPPQCSGGGDYTNPFPGGWEPNRLDMGYDGTFKGQIVAPFAGKIVYAATGVATWGGYIEIAATTQPVGLPTKTLYFAEGVGPLVKTGQDVTQGQPIAQAVPNALYNGIVGNIEFGVSTNGPGYVDTYALTLGCGQCPAYTTASRAEVLNFAKWVETDLHVAPPATTDDAGCA